MSQQSIFVSLNNKDLNLGETIAEFLSDEGFEPRIYSWDVSPGDSIIKFVEDSVKQARVMILLWSKHAENSFWVSEEYRNFYMKLQKDPTVKIIVVKLDKTTVPQLMADKRYISYRGDRMSLKDELLWGITGIRSMKYSGKRAPESARIGNLSIQELVKLNESRFLEFKSSLIWDNDIGKKNGNLLNPVIKTICGFMNAEGGTLLIGVNDLGEAIGLEQDYSCLTGRHNSIGFEQHLTSLFNRDVGAVFRNLFVVSFVTRDGKEICRVDANPAPKPVFMSVNNERVFYVRIGGSIGRLDSRDTLEYSKRRWG